MFFRFVTEHECDGWTDGQNYDPQDRASIAASSGKKSSQNLSFGISELFFCVFNF